MPVYRFELNFVPHGVLIEKKLPKAQRIRGLSSAHQNNFFTRMSHLQFLLFLCCFRQGWVHVKLRNRNNIGLIWFMFISSGDFWPLCRTNTAWWSKKEILFPIAQNNLKLGQKWCRHTEDPWLKYIESIFVDSKNVSDRFCLYMNIWPQFLPQVVRSTV